MMRFTKKLPLQREVKIMQFSKANLRNPAGVLICPLAAAATFTDDYNITQLTEQNLLMRSSLPRSSVQAVMDGG